MSTIDIRMPEAESIRKVQFADYSSNYATHIDIEGGNTFRFEDSDTCGEARFRLADIDNIILALQKLKEVSR